MHSSERVPTHLVISALLLLAVSKLLSWFNWTRRKGNKAEEGTRVFVHSGSRRSRMRERRERLTWLAL